MPLTAAFIDECRAAFGTECINDAIRGGINGLPTFYAVESGIEVGTPRPEPERFVWLEDMVIRPPEPKIEDRRARK